MAISPPKVNLNPEQKEAVIHGDGPLLVIAGAGTGKTTVITERIKHLILEREIKPSEILALTFTEKAAREMEERIDKALPYGYTQMWLMTFHSFCDRVLRQEALHIGLDPKYKLMSEAEATHLVRKHLFTFDLSYFRPLGNPTKFISGMLSHFSRLQDEDITPKDYWQWAEKKAKKVKSPEDKVEAEKWLELAGAYKTYDEIKIKEGVMDFGDLITKTLKLFRDRPNILNKYQDQFKYVLVDEFQDTNYAQNELAIMLSDKRKNITVSGDDDQSIYRFRGAAVSNILQFRKVYPESKIVVLTKNYRTAQCVLDKAYDLVQFNNPDRLEVKEDIDKHLISQRKNVTGEIGFIHKDRVENEAEAVVSKIEELLSKGFSYKDVAILVRANNHAEPFIRALQRRGLPYQFLGPGRLFRQPEVVDLVSYLKVLYDYEDSVSLYRLFSMDVFAIAPRDLIKIGNYAKRYNLTFYEAAEKIDDIFVSEPTKDTITKVVGIIEKHIAQINKETAGQLLYFFLEEMGLLPVLLNPDTPEAQKRAANIAKLFDKLKSYEVDHEDSSVRAVVDWIELSMELGESPLAADTDWTGVNAINILTVHSAKGLEFPIVFLVNLVSQRFPSTERREQIPIPEELIKEYLPQGDYHTQEERRLFYVGMTRARDYLYLTAANYYGEGKRDKKLSQFIFEAIGDTLTSAEDNAANATQLSILDYSSKKHADSEHNMSSEEQEGLHVDYISYSQIDTFRTCPLHYKLRYVYKVPTPASSALSFGQSMHAALNSFYLKVQNKEKGTINLIEECLKESWVREGFTSRKHEEKMYEQGITYLHKYHKDHFNPKLLPVALEKNFTIPIEHKGKSLRVGGKIDRVDVLSDGRVEILDYKTGANVPTQKEVDNNLQLTIYALAADLLRESPFPKPANDIVLSLYYFETQQKITTVRTREQLKEAIAELIDWKEQIEHSDFKCSHGFLCQKCEYNMFCNSD